MYINLMRMTTMRAKMRIVMTVSLNLKANASHVCLHEGKRKPAQNRVQQWQQHLVRSCLGAANGSKQLGNGTMALRGAQSGPNGLFVALTVGVRKFPKAMGFVRRTVAESDASMQVGVETVPKTQLRFALPTAGASDVSIQVDVERVL
jgi:type II secretory pathway component PulM